MLTLVYLTKTSACSSGELYLVFLFVILENAMDGEALLTLIGLTPGPDCLKDLVKKVGLRLKVYKAIKVLYDTENVSYYQ